MSSFFEYSIKDFLAVSPILVRGYNTLHNLFPSEMYDVQYDTASPLTHYGRSSTQKGSFADEKCPKIDWQSRGKPYLSVL
jgi:hypothetical protein